MAIKLAYCEDYDTQEQGITGPPSNAAGGQTFTSAGWSIEYIKIYGRRRDTAVDVGNIRVSIQGVSGEDDNPDGSTLVYKDFDGMDWVTTDAWHTITFDAPIIVSNSTKYTIVIETLNSPAWPGMLYWEYNNDPGDSFAGGERHMRSFGTWGVAAAMDYLFEIWGTSAVPEQPKTPAPGNTITNVTLDQATISWEDGTLNGNEATSYDVYYGDNAAEVAAADNTDVTGIYRGNQVGTSFTITGVTLGSPFDYLIARYWRIDAVNDAGTTTGIAWSFAAMAFAPPLPTGVTLDAEGEPTGTPTGESGMLTVRRLVVAANDKIWYEDL